MATWNVNSVKARLPRLLSWLEEAAPDVVCLQETKCRADQFPAAEVAGLGYETAGPRRGPLERRGDPVEGRCRGRRERLPGRKGPHPYTYWDYRAGMFHKKMGMRIDLFYATTDVTERVQTAYVDREARKGKGPSDHAPVVVDLTPATAA